MADPLNVRVIGAGGIGLALLPALCRYLNFIGRPIEMTIVDGDTYEEGNRKRQAFRREGPKAEVTVEELSPQFENITFRSRNRYITPSNIITIIGEGDLVLLCVDNHATRRLVEQRCSDLRTATLISGGNDLEDGNVMIYERKHGSRLNPPYTSYHKEIAKPQDENPGEAVKAVASEGCQEQQASQPQLIVTNNFIAALMLNCVYTWIQGKIDYDEVVGDVVWNQARKIKHKEQS